MLFIIVSGVYREADDSLNLLVLALVAQFMWELSYL